MTRPQTLVVAASVVVTSLLLAGSAPAQVSSADRACIGVFNSSVRKVAKTHGRQIRKCLRDFASGRLATSAEGCIVADPSGKLTRSVTQAVAQINAACATPPAFGVTAVEPALVRAVVGMIDLSHGAFGPSLNHGLVANPVAAECQARVATALLKCSDRRVREFLACQKIGLRNGQITDAASLAATCLGSGALSQPDPTGRIDRDCGARIGRELSGRCIPVDLQAAFAPCDPSSPSDAAGVEQCLKRESACQLCLMFADVDGLSRDCDLFDDGDGGNGSCGAECGDGIMQGSETCDDGGASGGDGCSATCSIEGGWSCSGEPSVCTQNCGNGVLDGGETCDDNDATGGDGCSDACTVELNYTCTGEPSVCTPNCGNGTLDGSEVCDDGDRSSGDGCSSACQVEAGYNCSGTPSVCTFDCGNGSFQNGESCDDGDAASGDGCSSVCRIEPGWLCAGAPSFCSPRCGDGLRRGTELCDDGDTASGDGCSFNCSVETGFTCGFAQPSNCIAVCGDGFVRGFETCDDSDSSGGDGCSANFCRQEVGYTCTGQPSICVANCGDGDVDPGETCDDGDTSGGDGCSALCQGEIGWACGGQPSACVPNCGNSVLNSPEACDDGNSIARDGCSTTCQNEPGWVCPGPGLPCSRFDVFIDTPAHGIFTTSSAVTISGHYTTLLPGQVAVTVNGVPASSVNQALRTFTHTIPLSATNVFNPVRVSLTNTSNGDDVHDRIVIVRGQSVADGAFSPQSVALRINDRGLDAIEPLVAGLAVGSLNLASILPSGTTLIDECFISVIGCWGSARVRIASPPPSFSHLTLGIDSRTNAVFADIDIFNLRVDVDIDGSGLVPDCGLRLSANALQLTGDFGLSPLSSSPSNVDVNLAGGLGVQFTGFNDSFTSGLCDAPIIGDIIQALLPDIESAATNGIRGFLSDPDGGGPADSPIAEAIETTLAGISISGPVGQGLGLMFEAPLFQVLEDNTGITLGSNSRAQISVGSGPGQCLPPPGAPDLFASYSVSESFPVFGANTPVTNQPYGIGIAISTSGFNQLLRGQTECGLMRSSLSMIDLDGAGGTPPLAITSSLLSLIVPEFGLLPANTPLRIDIAPSMAPVVTGGAGPGGELTELKIAQVTLDIVQPGPETVWLSGVLDARLGMDLAFLPDGSGLAITLAPPEISDLAVVVLENPLGANEAVVEAVLPAIVQPLIPSLAGALSGFPLPEFFGLTLGGVEVSRTGQFLSLYADLD